jgi:hypothetical protein
VVVVERRLDLPVSANDSSNRWYYNKTVGENMTKLVSIVGILAITAGCGGTSFSPNDGQWEMVLTAGVDECNMGSSSDGEIVLWDLTVSEDGTSFTLIEVYDGNGTSTSTMTTTSSTTTTSSSTYTGSTTSSGSVLECALTGMDFSCAFDDMDDNQTTTDFDGHVDAVLTYQISVGGQFASEVDGSIDVAFEMSCVGTQCDELAMFGLPEMPCVSQETGTLTNL